LQESIPQTQEQIKWKSEKQKQVSLVDANIRRPNNNPRKLSHHAKKISRMATQRR
jgi:hypothetical protein